LATKLKNFEPETGNGNPLKNFFRHTAVKTLSFLLCVAALTGMALLIVFQNIQSYPHLGLGDILAERTFKSSQYLSNESGVLFDRALSASGWYASNKRDAEWAYRDNIDQLNKTKGIRYYIETPYGILYNTDDRELADFQDADVWYAFTDAETMLSYESSYGSFFFASPNRRTYQSATSYKAYFRLTDSMTATLRNNYEANRGRVLWFVGWLCVLGVLAFLCLLHLFLVCGRRANSGALHLTVLDRPWLDVSFLLCFLVYSGFLSIDVWVYGNINYNLPFFLRWLSGFAFAAAFATALYWVLAFVKRLKNRTFLRHTLIGAVFGGATRTVSRTVRQIVRHWKVTAQMGVYAGMCGGVCVIVPLLFAAVESYGFALFFGLLMTGGFAYLTARWAVPLSEVAQGLEKLSTGDSVPKMPEKGVSFVCGMAQSLNRAGDGMQSAVQKAMRSERFKAELISNVSHDLRTPLTSVITYADLLQSEGLDVPDAPRYVEIIAAKARRLKDLTDDLFEASKAASGELQVNLAPLDLMQLLSQSLGEMNDRLQAARLEPRISGTVPAVMADGRMLWRVFENLLGNILKYAMPGSRVYIDQSADQNSATVTLRNISQEPLPAEGEALTERFTRGDESRSSEGSGLGLSIVKSFMDLQKGTFAVYTDGDLFKAMLTLPLAPEM